MKRLDLTDMIRTAWIASAFAAVFTKDGVLCLVPVLIITFVAILFNPE